MAGAIGCLFAADHDRQCNQHQHHHSGRQPLPQLVVITPGGGGQLGLVNAALAGLPAEANHHPQQGINQHHRQDGMEQEQPIERLHRQRR